MKMTTSNFGTLLGGCIALTALSFAAIAQSQSTEPRTVHRSAIASMQTRSDFASRIENQLRQHGMEARVQLDGDSRDLLRIESQQLGRSDVYSFVNSMSAHQARQIGFSAIIFSNDKQHWDYDLARESMILSPTQP
ncbi:MAG: hypothetical protein DMG82_11725 [Acidobacteria bacterium]|nr:MAG: hypothetical protein DMG82_11725 [Acidobacteriota bacterium]